MKLQTTVDDFNSLPLLNKLFLALWQKKKGYRVGRELSFGQLTELSLALTNDLRFDTPLERSTFNNSLQYTEFNMSWDGKEPIEILFFELNHKLNRRILNYLVAHYKS